MLDAFASLIVYKSSKIDWDIAFQRQVDEKRNMLCFQPFLKKSRNLGNMGVGNTQFSDNFFLFIFLIKTSHVNTFELKTMKMKLKSIYMWSFYKKINKKNWVLPTPVLSKFTLN
jgi:hypothetical protein